MSRNAWIGTGAIGLALVLAVALGGEARSVGASSVSAAPEGLKAARLYAEARGVAVTLLAERPKAGAEPLESADLVIVAFPGLPSVGLEEALASWVDSGGTLVVGYGGRESSLDSLVLTELGVPPVAVRDDPPLSWSGWRAHRSSELELTDATSDLRLVTTAPDVAPEPPPGAEVLFADAAGEVTVFRFRRGAGRVIVLPSDVLSNARLLEADNAVLLEYLRSLSKRWVFEETSHGLVATVQEAQFPLLGRSVRWLALQCVLIYLLAAWSLGRPFGRPWRAPKAATGSTATLVRSLGVLHDQSGHFPEGARHLMEIDRQQGHRLLQRPAQRRRAEAVTTRSELIGLLAGVFGRTQ